MKTPKNATFPEYIVKERPEYAVRCKSGYATGNPNSRQYSIDRLSIRVKDNGLECGK